MEKKQADPNLVNAIKDRGRLYLAVFREVSDRYGEEKAISVMRAASRVIGIADGKGMAHFAPRDFAGMADCFAMGSDNGAAYATEIRQLDETCVEYKMMACPLKQSWVDAGCTDEEICTLLYCASAYDQAVYENAGFDFEHEMWAPGKEGCCRTRLTEKAPA